MKARKSYAGPFCVIVIICAVLALVMWLTVSHLTDVEENDKHHGGSNDDFNDNNVVIE